METILKQLTNLSVPQRLAKKIIKYNDQILSITQDMGGYRLLIECREGIDRGCLDLYKEGSKYQLPYKRKRISRYINFWEARR